MMIKEMVLIILCFIIGTVSLSFSATYTKAEVSYLAGEKALKDGITNLEEFKTLLNSNFNAIQNFKVEDMRNRIKDRVRLSIFLKVLKEFNPNFDYSEERCLDIISNKFVEARNKFKTVINEDNTFISAYLCEAAVYVKMGDYKEALPIFNNAIELMRKPGTETIQEIKFIDPSYSLWNIIEDLFYSMADEMMMQRLTPPEGKKYNEWAEEVITVFKDWQVQWIEKEIDEKRGQISQQTDLKERQRLEREIDELNIKRVNAFCELARFYIRHHEKQKIKDEITHTSKKMEEKNFSQRDYSPIIEEIKNEYESLQEIKIGIAPELAAEFEGSVTVKFFRDKDCLTCNFLYLWCAPDECWVEFKSDFSCNLPQRQSIFLKQEMDPKKIPTCEIRFSQIEIKKEDRLPFYVAVDGDMPFHKTKDGKEDMRGTTVFIINGIEYPRIDEDYRLAKDENKEWTILQTIKNGEETEEKFKKNSKFTSTILISPFCGKEVEICKATWPPSKDKIKTRWISGIFILPMLLLR